MRFFPLIYAFNVAHVLVRMFMREDNMIEGVPAYKKLVELLKKEGIGGVTVLRSIMGYGTTGEYHYEGIEVLSYGLPVVVEFVEEESKAMGVLQALLSEFKIGLVTMEVVDLWCF